MVAARHYRSEWMQEKLAINSCQMPAAHVGSLLLSLIVACTKQAALWMLLQETSPACNSCLQACCT
jgi:hypothetical protein